MTVQKPHLVVVGSVAIDWIITPRAERPESVGGSATFFAMAASYLAQVRLVGVVGRDFPDYAVADLKAAGVDVSGLEIVQDGLTFRWKGQYHENMNDRTTLETHLNVFEKFQPNLPAEFRGSEYLFLANIQPRLQSDVFAQMQRPRLVGLDTMNLWISIANDDLKAVLKDVDVLTLNDEEARQLSGEHNIVKAARAIRALGPRNVVIKRGEYGALLFDADGEMFSAPALPLEDVVDPTGAGDSFAGGFMGWLARPGVEPNGASLRTAMIYGSVMASFCVEGFSYDRLKGLDQATIQKRFETFAALTNFARASLT
ncbi:PfkB family carbohydrate kinase [Nannocystis bainbridge]|uniref:PfkB family carbohydrate kinase n=1 Tax=Nannocystis bainbridge TaxID=2995303 RepID=A0ABT5DZ71_9BACT|nr:PfkB family carbohydrate kinase [Nannocystis bainbridge]MDC0718879.1 PfkB family carbohydrate kinase [Nannocystis bainbridge]